LIYRADSFKRGRGEGGGAAPAWRKKRVTVLREGMAGGFRRGRGEGLKIVRKAREEYVGF